MKLSGKKIALLVAEDYQELEVWYPYYRLLEEGADVVRVAAKAGETYLSKLGYPCPSDAAAGDVSAGDFDAVVIPGGWMLCCTDVLRGRRATSFMAIAHDMINAGADWVDEQCVVDGNVITARKPDDLPAFCKAIIEALGD